MREPLTAEPLSVQPLTIDRWDDLVAVFGRRGLDPTTCWCRRFLGGDGRFADNRAAMRHEVETASRPPGVLAYRGDAPAGWSRVGPRSSVPGVGGNRALARVLTDDPGAWWVSCFVVHPGHRRTGVGSALLAAGVALAREHGAWALEGHPVDVRALTAATVGGSALFTGTLAMFAAAGFEEVARTYRSRPVVRLSL